ncbi:MAG: hypothetical protein HY360_27215 [Verrucomicrobia bacterium]|nr:hypothetical protein [Verrucomicrobiota bacterium]
MTEQKWEFPKPCVLPVYWNPNPFAPNGVYRLITDKAQSHSGDKCVYLKGDLACEQDLKVKAGDRVRMSFWARRPDPGQVHGLLYAYGVDKEGKDTGVGDSGPQFAGESGKEWKKHTETLIIPAEVKGCTVRTVKPVLRSLTVAYFDDVEVEVIPSVATGQSAPETDPVNGGFEEWTELEAVPAGWDLAVGKVFPQNWTVEGRPGERGFLRRACNPPETVDRFGQWSLALDGKVLSKYIFKDALNKTLKISFWARGKGGAITARLREYREPTGEELEFIVDVVEQKTSEAWREYVGQATMVSAGVSFARVEMEGQGVVIDRLKVVVLKPKEEAKQEIPQAALSIPVSGKKPMIDGVFSADEWSAAVGIKRGFMNIYNHCAVERQSDCYLSADNEKLYVCVRTPPRRGGLKTTITNRDGSVWADESVEIYINPDVGQKTIADVYQLVVNAAGAVFDQRVKVSIGQNEAIWNCKGLEAASAFQEDWWILEMAIPLAEVGVKPGQPFGLNVARNLCNPSEYAALSGMAYNDYAHTLLSTIVDGAPSVQWGLQGNLREGPLSLLARVMNPTAKESGYDLALAVGDKQDRQTLKLAPGATREVALNAGDLTERAGEMTLRLCDQAGKPLVSHQLRFDAGKLVAENENVESQDYRVEFYPDQKKLNVRLLNVFSQGRFGRCDISIFKDDKLVTRQSVKEPLLVEDRHAAHITIPFDPPADGIYLVRAYLYDKSGNCRSFITETVEKKSVPWLGNELGKERIVIPPFMPLETKGSSVACWGRTHKLDASGLPSEVRSQGEPALAGPVRFVLDDGKQLHTAPPGKGNVKFKERAPDRVSFEGITRLPGLTVKLNGRMEYDGMIRYETELVPESKIEAARLYLEIPVRNLRYFHWAGGMRVWTNASMQNLPPEGEYQNPDVPVWSPAYSYADAQTKGHPISLYLPGGDGVIWSSLGVSLGEGSCIQGNFLPYLWLGNAKYGLAWFTDNDRGWITDKDAPCFELVRKGTDATLRIYFVSKRATISAPRKIVFGLMATPVRPRITGGNAAITPTSEGMGYGMTRKEVYGITYRDYYLAKQNLEMLLKRKGIFSAHMYIANDMLPAGDPAMAYMKHEWMREPFADYADTGHAVYKVCGANSENYWNYITCGSASQVDYQVHCMNEDMAHGAIDGVYLDNSYPATCQNLQHPSCAYVREDGSLQGGYHLFATRDFIKRCAVLSHLHKTRLPHFTVHSTSAMVIPCFSFADLCVDGEWGQKGDFMEFFTLPYLEVFGAGAWGPNQGWLPELQHLGVADWKKPTRTLLATLRLYDMWIWDANCDQAEKKRLEELEKKFGVQEPDCQFIGYWRDEARVITGLPRDVKSSFYVRLKRGALIYLSNFNKEKQEIKARLDFRQWGLTDCKVADAENGQGIALNDGMLALAVEGRDFRVICIDAK